MIQRYRPRSIHLIALLLLLIAGNEVQRTWAQERGHRERSELAIQVAEISCKVDWLVTTQRLTVSASPPTQPTLRLDGSECGK